MQDKIALEEHFAVPETLADSERYFTADRWSEAEQALLDVADRRLALMDETGIGRAIVSLNSPAVQDVPDRREAAALARRANDALAEQVAGRPDRLSGFACLPMQDPEAAAEEARRCVVELGFVGALVNGWSRVDGEDGGVYLDDARYQDFWAAYAALGRPFYLHPRDPVPSQTAIYDGHPWLVGSAWSFGVETATHALRLMGSGLFDRHPDLQVVLGHLGEGLPFLIWRVDHRVATAPRGITTARSFQEYFRQNCYLTTSGAFHTPALHNAIAEVGVDRVLYSTDFPFERMTDAAMWFDAALISENDRRRIGRSNAAALFGLDGPPS